MHWVLCIYELLAPSEQCAFHKIVVWFIGSLKSKNKEDLIENVNLLYFLFIEKVYMTAKEHSCYKNSYLNFGMYNKISTCKINK